MMLWWLGLLCHAEEGFWTSDRIVHSAPTEWNELIPTLSNRSSTLLQSIVALPTCSGTLASPNGLVVSNAHCIRPYLEDNKTRFVAPSFAEEIPIKGFSLYVTKNVLDVQEEMRKGIKEGALQDYVLYRTQRNKRGVLKRCREESKKNRCTVHWDPIQKRYQLTVEYRYDDIRLVHIPSHLYAQLDIAFIRVYENNKPISTPQYLTMHPTQLTKETPIAVLGFPQKSARYAHPQEWDVVISTQYPYILQHTQRVLQALTPFLLLRPPDSKAHKLYAMVKTIEHNTNVLVQMFSQQAPRERLGKREADFLAWCTQSAEQSEYCISYALYESILKAKHALATTIIDHRWISMISDLLFSARRRFGWRYNRQFSNEERWDGYKDSDKEALVLHLQQLPSLLDRPLEERLLQSFLPHVQIEPIQKMLSEYSTIEETLSVWANDIPPLLDVQESILYLDPKTPEQENLWLSLGAQIEQQNFDTMQHLQSYDDALDKQHNIWIEGYRRMLGDHFYPDAAGDLRISFGNIIDASQVHLFSPQASIPSFRSLISQYLYLFPYFISDVDVTKGNSGSPTIDPQGHWIGIVFGGNDSTHTSSWFYAQHTEIHHISLRHIAWYLTIQADVHNLRTELNIEREAFMAP